MIWAVFEASSIICAHNPKRGSVLGIKAYPTIQDVPEPVDLAVIVTPAPTIPGIIRDCGEVGEKFADFKAGLAVLGEGERRGEKAAGGALGAQVDGIGPLARVLLQRGLGVE